MGGNQAFEVYEIVYEKSSGSHSVSGYFSESSAWSDAERLEARGAGILAVRSVD